MQHLVLNRPYAVCDKIKLFHIFYINITILIRVQLPVRCLETALFSLLVNSHITMKILTLRVGLAFGTSRWILAQSSVLFLYLKKYFNILSHEENLEIMIYTLQSLHTMTSLLFSPTFYYFILLFSYSSSFTFLENNLLFFWLPVILLYQALISQLEFPELKIRQTGTQCVLF